MYTYNAVVTRVVDGDTFDLKVQLGFKICIGIRVRLYGVDTPEVYGVKKESEEYQKGEAASEFARDWLKASPETIEVHTVKDAKGKYGRYLATIVNPITKESLNEALLANGHATKVLYD